jgi:hypothetical protein
MGNAHWRNPDGASETRLGNASFLEDLAKENARMDGGKPALDHACLQSVVIDDRDVKGVTDRETKTHSPLVVDADAPLSLAVTPQRFKPIGGWRPQIGELGGSVQLRKSHCCAIANFRWQATRFPCGVEPLGFGIRERPDHLVTS